MTTRVTKPLTKATATGNGTPTTDDLIRLSSSVLGAQAQLRRDVARWFGEMNAKLETVDCKVDKIDDRIGTIEQARSVEAALAVQAKEFLAAQRTSDLEKEEKHALSFRFRVTIVVAAAGAVLAAIATAGPGIVAGLTWLGAHR